MASHRTPRSAPSTQTSPTSPIVSLNAPGVQSISSAGEGGLTTATFRPRFVISMGSFVRPISSTSRRQCALNSVMFTVFRMVILRDH